jgi:hypothetical protein
MLSFTRISLISYIHYAKAVHPYVSLLILFYVTNIVIYGSYFLNTTIKSCVFPYWRSLGARLLLWRRGFTVRAVHMESVVGNVALGQVFV